MRPDEAEEMASPAAVWWRADEYEIVNGTHIRPVAGATIEPYDAVGSYHDFLIGDGVAHDAYVDLYKLDLNDTDAVLEWCSQYGLLGILHHHLVGAYFWPTWEPRLLKGLKSYKPHQIVLAEALTFDRFGGRAQVDEMFAGRNDRKDDGRLLTDSELRTVLDSQRSSPIRESHALVRDLWSFNHNAVDIIEGYGQFFPDVEGISAWTAERTPRPGSLPWAPPRWEGDRDLRQRASSELNRELYPLPDSDDFTSRYAEPRYLFHRIAHDFQAAVESLATQADDEPFVHAAVRTRGYEVPPQLVTALREVSPSVAWHEDGWSHAWEVRSLLAAMSAMVVQDITLLDGRLPRCRKCGDRFFTARSDAEYCSAACGIAFRVARHRKKKVESKSETSHKDSAP